MKPSQYVHGFKRGVYFAPFYENTREYLRSEIEESELVGSRKLENDVDDVMDWWKPKAIRRYTNLLEQDRIRPEHLYYRDMIQMRTWEEVQQVKDQLSNLFPGRFVEIINNRAGEDVFRKSFVEIGKLIKRPPSSPLAKAWIAHEMESKAR